MLLGFLLGQIRTLQRLSWLANLAVWLNVIVIIMTYVLAGRQIAAHYTYTDSFASMVVTSKFGPDFVEAKVEYPMLTGPKTTSAGFPAGNTLRDRINGLMNCVFAYGGATLFNELMAEMRRPYALCPLHFSACWS